jgi:prepilin-type N-terminal cleavage/methylation domain-containing protein/prepilin-type processing-associated H-X9-DG protein
MIRRRGLTLIEFLVVASLIGILLALAIPAVSAARASARRAGCASNLRQIGVALHAYESALGCLPTATGGTGGGYRSFLVAILPYVEQRPLYDAINFQMDLMHDDTLGNMTAKATAVSLYLCPADGLDRAGREAATNYAGCQGGGVQKYGYNGVFAVLQPVRLRDITDGASGTAAVSEWLTGPLGFSERDPLRSVFQTPEGYREPGQLDRFAESCRGVDVAAAAVHPRPKGVNWLFGDFGHSLYNHVLGPGEPSCLNGTGYQVGAWTAGGNHGPGVNVLFADGRVKFVGAGVDLAAWRASASRSGRELVGID